jgi:hypothetical protein
MLKEGYRGGAQKSHKPMKGNMEKGTTKYLKRVVDELKVESECLVACYPRIGGYHIFVASIW